MRGGSLLAAVSRRRRAGQWKRPAPALQAPASSATGRRVSLGGRPSRGEGGAGRGGGQGGGAARLRRLASPHLAAAKPEAEAEALWHRRCPRCCTRVRPLHPEDHGDLGGRRWSRRRAACRRRAARRRPTRSPPAARGSALVGAHLFRTGTRGHRRSGSGARPGIEPQRIHRQQVVYTT